MTEVAKICLNSVGLTQFFGSLDQDSLAFWLYIQARTKVWLQRLPRWGFPAYFFAWRPAAVSFMFHSVWVSLSRAISTQASSKNQTCALELHYHSRIGRMVSSNPAGVGKHDGRADIGPAGRGPCIAFYFRSLIMTSLYKIILVSYITITTAILCPLASPIILKVQPHFVSKDLLGDDLSPICIKFSSEYWWDGYGFREGVWQSWLKAWCGSRWEKDGEEVEGRTIFYHPRLWAQSQVEGMIEDSIQNQGKEGAEARLQEQDLEEEIVLLTSVEDTQDVLRSSCKLFAGLS